MSTFASGFCTTLSMAIDAGGNLYLANFYGTVAKITPAGVVSTLASLSGYVTGLAFDGGGNLYASSTIAGAISRITTAGVVSTFEGGFSGPIAIASAPTPPTVTTQPQNQGFINGQSVAAKFGIGASGQGHQLSVASFDQQRSNLDPANQQHELQWSHNGHADCGRHNPGDCRL